MEAACNDLGLIKDIPGYQIIMKAVLKHQIQQLVEQLSETTGEQSVLLTASVSDETFSHLGSEFGKTFLDGHDEIKAQFLTFLKNQQTKKANQPFASCPSKSVGMKKRKAMKTPQSSKRSAPHRDIYIQKNDSLKESSDGEQEQLEGTAKAVKKPGIQETTVKYAEPTNIENNHETNIGAIMERSAKSGIYVDNAEEANGNTQELSEGAVKSVTDSAEDTEKNMETLPVSDPVPLVGTPKLEMDVSFQNQRVISDALNTDLEMDTVIVKKEAGLDAEEGSDIDEGDRLIKDDSDWEPSIKKQKKSSSSGSGSSLTVSADQAQNVMNESFMVDQTKIEYKRFKCGICNYTSRFKSNIRRHQSQHLTECKGQPDVEHVRNSNLCDQCARPFKTKRGLELHVNSKHLNIFRFKCSVCPAKFNMLSAFRGHLVSHHKELKEKCSQCGAEFQYKQSLKDHKRIAHNIPEKKKYVCEECNQNFSCRDTLLQHRRGMHGGKAFDCPKCNKTFKWRSSLAYHTLTAKHSQ